MQHEVESGEHLAHVCQNKDEPIRDWVKVGITRAGATGNPAIFWLNPERAHDANLIKKMAIAGSQYTKAWIFRSMRRVKR